MTRPDEVEFSIQTIKAMFGTFTPKTYWTSTIIRPLVAYIEAMEAELEKRSIQATFNLNAKIKGENDNEDDSD